MIGFKVQSIGKDNFFDSEAVIKALTDAERRVLSKFGAFVRRSAKQSIKDAETKESRKARRVAKKAGAALPKKEYQASKPGEPPRSREGSLKKFILFGYDVAEHNVVIGPTPIRGQASDTPARLEFGGQFRSKKTGKIIKVARRPFMVPARDKEMSRMPAMFADSLKGK